MQRKLSEIAEIPRILSSTLATVSETFNKLMPLERGYERGVRANKHRMDDMSKYQYRKYSYDEDVNDYELSDVSDREDKEDEDEEDGGDAEDEARSQDDERQFRNVEPWCQYTFKVKQSKVKDITPESDYASEANYQPSVGDESQAEDASYTKEVTDKDVDVEEEDEDVEEGDDDDAIEIDEEIDDNEDGDDDDDEDVNDIDSIAENLNCDESYAQENFEIMGENNLGENLNSFASQVKQIDKATDAAVEVDDDGSKDLELCNDEQNAEDDFLSTTLTWHLRNIPKLQLNDEDNFDYESSQDENNDESNTHVVDGDTDDESEIVHYRIMVNFDSPENDKSDELITASHDNEDLVTKMQEDEQQQQQQELQEQQKQTFKLDNMDRAWPWADREKIIYKQSTCHLVPRKPLGLVEQRKQLLAKQHLWDNLHKKCEKLCEKN